MFASMLMPFDQFCGFMFIGLVIALPLLGTILKKVAEKGKH